MDARKEEESMQGESGLEEESAMIVEPVHSQGHPPSIPRSLAWFVNPPTIVVS